jgi:hypothetical protein
MAAARNKWAFKPYTVPPIPSGSYDPALDAQLYAAQRGYGDTAADVGTQTLRAGDDYGLNVEDINRTAGRSATDLSTARTREEQDYGTSVGLLTRRYKDLGDVQAQQAAGSGITGGGAILQAAAKRKANQGLEQTQLDTTHNRFLEDNTLAGARLGEDQQLALGRAGLGYGRQTTDLGTSLTRAGRELGAFTLDTGASKAFQAAQAGYAPPDKPSNEFRSPSGVPYKVLKGAGGPIYVDRNGRRLPGRPR